MKRTESVSARAKSRVIPLSFFVFFGPFFHGPGPFLNIFEFIIIFHINYLEIIIYNLIKSPLFLWEF